MTPPPAPTIGSVLDLATEAYERLADLGASIDDEWSYVQDLSGAWQARFDEVRAARGSEAAGPAVAAALAAAIEEIDQVDDPHRAIDWLSTFPQVALLALGERP